MSACFWTGFVNCAEPSCGGDAPEPPEFAANHVALVLFDLPGSIATIDGFRLFEEGRSFEWPGYAAMFDCAGTGRPAADVDVFALGYDEVRVEGVWYGPGDSIPAPSGWSPQSPCPGPDPCNGVNFNAIGPLTIAFRGPSLDAVEVPFYLLSDTCF